MKTCPFLPYSSDGNPDNPDQTSDLWGLLGEIMYTYSQLIRYVYIHVQVQFHLIFSLFLLQHY